MIQYNATYVDMPKAKLEEEEKEYKKKIKTISF